MESSKNNELFNRACVVLVALLPVYYSSYWVCSEHPMLTKGGELKSMRERTPGVGGASYSVQEPSLGPTIVTLVVLSPTYAPTSPKFWKNLESDLEPTSFWNWEKEFYFILFYFILLFN
jgi:hypothetical protein